jgi:predicted phosphodiesterase
VKVVIYSDLQATESQERLRSDPNTPLQRWRVTTFYEKLVGIMEKHGASAVWDLGDTLDDRSEVPVQTIQAVTDMLDLVAPEHSASIKLVGNHEQHYKNAGVHSGGMFKKWFRVFDRPQTVTVETRNRAIDVCCLPFPSTTDDLDESVELLLSQCSHNNKVLLGHLDVQGALYPSGETISAGLKSTHLAEFDLCLFGHVHRHQQLAKNAWYVGSPFQQDFSERDQKKYVCILDLVTLSLEWEEINLLRN